MKPANKKRKKIMKQSQELRKLLESIDHKSYPAYKTVQGAYDFKDYILSIDHVQGDPFASPSKVSVFVPHKINAFPSRYFDHPWKRTALQDYLLRCFSQEMARFNFKARGSGKSGLIATSRPGQEVLERTACECGDSGITARFEVGFPAFGRTINSGELIKIIFEFLPGCVRNVFHYKNRDPKQVLGVVELAEDQEFIRNELRRLNLVSFAADGAILPRETGISDRPMKGSVPFVSPDSLKITLNLPHHGPIQGMAVRRGITLIVGGGYHGKSTLLKALEAGVYNHIAGDGREYVITDDTAVKLRAEDGRSINNVDISLFINDLPNGKNTSCFSSADASGSTSQAAAVIEGIEAGATSFLIDEDTSATNFMLRDELMQKIVSRDKEPITPFIERARELYEKAGVSTVLVAGSSGAYFYIADTVIQMDNYRPCDITEQVRSACEAFRETSAPALTAPGFKLPSAGRKMASSSGSREVRKSGRENAGHDGRNGGNRRGDDRKGDDRIKVKVFGKDSFQVAKEPVDLRFVEQLADGEQTAALAQMVRLCLEKDLLARYPLKETVAILMKEYEKKGLAAFNSSSYTAMGLCMPRIQEIYACLNRFRG